nr:MerR family transcriptional regulator [Nakamurella aerolata]
MPVTRERSSTSSTWLGLGAIDSLTFMRIGELAKQSGVPAATIKYYVREGLLPAGESTGYNQVDYTDAHLRRLRLVRTLIDIGGLPVAVVREVLSTLDADDASLFHLMGVAQQGTIAHRELHNDDAERRAKDLANQLVSDNGWQAKKKNAAYGALVEAIASLIRIGREDLLPLLPAYAQAAETAAAADIAVTLGDVTTPGEHGVAKEQIIERVVAGTVLGDRMIAAMRRLAAEAHSRRALARRRH